MAGDKIREVRELKGMSAYRLEELTGISRSTIIRYEKKQIKKIPFENLIKICEALEVDIKDMI